MDEIKKNVFVGETGNKAEVVEEERSSQSLEANYAKTLVKQAGELYKPLGSNYLGSAVVHYYEAPGIAMNQRNYFFVCQTDVGKVDENHADLGWKGLRDALLKAYGRKEPKKVRN